MTVAETFLSIQGEGPRTGRPCFFVRTAGCNLECPWCDTRWADRVQGSTVSPAGIVAGCLSAFGGLSQDHRRPLVCVTGGEPTLQPDLSELLVLLVGAGFDVDLMTNGTMNLDNVPAQVSIVVDLKIHLLQSGWMPPFVDSSPSGRPGPGDAVKFVVADRAEFDFAARWAVAHGMFDRGGEVLVSPAWGLVAPARLADWILRSEPRFRLGIQMHKYIWGADTRM